MHETASDEELMAQVAGGKRQPLEALVERYATPLLTFLHRMTGDYHRAEELFQEVFLAVWRRRELYAAPKRFKPWLYAIAVNRCRTDFRRGGPATQPLAEQLLTHADRRGHAPLNTSMATEQAMIISTAVARLPQPQREVIVLRIWQQMSYGEIATVLEQPDGTVRSHMHRGLCALRRMLEGCLEDQD